MDEVPLPFAFSQFRPEKTALGEVQSPKGREFGGKIKAGIPVFRYSRRETPINRVTRYLRATRCVKAILPLLTGEHAEYRGGGPVLDPAEHDVVEDAGRGVPDEERKGIQAGTAGRGEGERSTRLISSQCLRRRPARRVRSERPSEK